MASQSTKQLRALAVLRDRLRDAIGFSETWFNEAECQHTTVKAARSAWRRWRREHRAWQAEVQEAIAELAGFDFPVIPPLPLGRSEWRLKDWREIDVSVPQVCFSLLPHHRNTNGKIVDRVWILGAGDNMSGVYAPEELEPVRAGTWIHGIEAEKVAGVFDDSTVEDWRIVLAAVEEAERRLLLSRRAKQSNDGSKGARVINEAHNELRSTYQARIDALVPEKMSYEAACATVATEVGVSDRTVKRHTTNPSPYRKAAK